VPRLCQSFAEGFAVRGIVMHSRRTWKGSCGTAYLERGLVLVLLVARDGNVDRRISSYDSRFSKFG